MAYLNELGHARGAAYMVRKSRPTGPTTRYANGPEAERRATPLTPVAPTPRVRAAPVPGAMSLEWSPPITSAAG